MHLVKYLELFGRVNRLVTPDRFRRRAAPRAAGYGVWGKSDTRNIVGVIGRRECWSRTRRCRTKSRGATGAHEKSEKTHLRWGAI